MKILFVINALTIGGAQILLEDLSKHLVITSNKVIVATFRAGPLVEKLKENGITVIILGEKYFDLIAFYKLINIIKDFKPDIIHTHLFRATAWSRLAKLLTKTKAKLITTIHGEETTTYHIIERAMVNLSDYMIFPSQHLAKWYSNTIKSIDPAKLKVIYPGVVINKPQNYAPKDKLIIGSLSRLHPVKGLDILLKAIQTLKNNKIDFELYIGGGGKGKDQLVDIVKKLKLERICKFVDNIPNKTSYLEELSIFVSPSRKEAFGINICEAMERSLPIVSTNVGGIPEVVKDGLTGFLCKPNDPESLSKNLELLVKDFELRKKMGEEGRKRVEKLFNRKNTINEHLDLYKNLANKKRIHFVISSCELGGGERLAINLIKNLKQRGWEITATCAGNPLYSELLSMNIKSSVASMNLGGIMFAFKVLKDIKTFKPNIISSHLNKASLFSGLISKITGIKTVSHIHGLNRKIYYQFCDKQIAVSDAVKKYMLEQNINESTIVTINNCIDKPAISPRQFPKRPLNIAITAKLHKNKGHEWALKAISNGIQQLNIDKIHIFGDGPERNNLENLVKSLTNLKNKIVFHGFVNDPSKYYDNIDIALLPSLGEGIPLSLLEVMRIGIPCIATNVGGIPEIIINNESGILITPNENQELINAINKLSNKENYEYYSKQAFERFKKVNNQDKMINDFEKVLLDLL